MKKISALALVAVTGLSACVSPEVVARTQTGDRQMSCEQISSELTQLDAIRAEAHKGKSASGQNVAAVLLFWPAAIGNYANANQAEKAANERNEVLVELAAQKRCSI